MCAAFEWTIILTHFCVVFFVYCRAHMDIKNKPKKETKIIDQVVNAYKPVARHENEVRTVDASSPIASSLT